MADHRNALSHTSVQLFIFLCVVPNFDFSAGAPGDDLRDGAKRDIFVTESDVCAPQTRIPSDLTCTKYYEQDSIKEQRFQWTFRRAETQGDYHIGIKSVMKGFAGFKSLTISAISATNQYIGNFRFEPTCNSFAQNPEGKITECDRTKNEGNTNGLTAQAFAITLEFKEADVKELRLVFMLADDSLKILQSGKDRDKFSFVIFVEEYGGKNRCFLNHRSPIFTSQVKDSETGTCKDDKAVIPNVGGSYDASGKPYISRHGPSYFEKMNPSSPASAQNAPNAAAGSTKSTETTEKAGDGEEPPDAAGPEPPTASTAVTVNPAKALAKANGSIIPIEKPPPSDTYSEDPGTDASKNKKPAVTVRKVYNGCSRKKGCIGEPPSCVPHKSCQSVVSYNKEENTVKFQIMGKATKYVAIALSTDEHMGNDSVVECVREHDMQIRAYASWNLYHDNKREKDHSAISGVKGSYIDGYITCEFWRKAVTTYQNVTFDLGKDTFFMLHARGNEAKDGPDGNIGYHGAGSSASTRKYDLDKMFAKSKFQLVLEKLHSVLFILAWLFCFPVSAFISRYYKETYSNKEYKGFTFWYAMHAAFAWVGTGFAFLGLVAIVGSNLRMIGWGDDGWNFHNISALALLGLLTIEVGTGYLIKFVNTTKRCQVANWIHGLLGHGSFFIAFANFYGTMSVEGGLPCSAKDALIAWIIIYFIIHLIMSYLVCYVDFVMGEGVSRAYNIIHVRVAPHPSDEDVTGSGMRKILLNLFMFFSAAVSIALSLMYVFKEPCIVDLMV